MLADHINTLLLTSARPELYAPGRMAFRLFVLIWARNVMLRPERLQLRANRMRLWAVVTQPAFSLAFRGYDSWYALNILFVFAGVTQLLAWHHWYRQAILPKVRLPALAVSTAASPAVGTENRFMPGRFFYVAYAGHRAGQAAGLA
ncbi:TraX family protein [Kosakonia sacchari]|uniref:TraX family protein n=1 Tax=Kosakonia sacchari TaxID=1158459 RepID=UPI002ACE447F|nr:TraX family protein [Kosakonia sacchari]MDZ7320103.1 TraX family protein [Kosakonia sacchari]